MTQEQTHEIALMRYSVIAPLVSGLQDSFSSHEAFFRDASARGVNSPDGTLKHFAPTTIKKWYNNYNKGGFDALIPSSRADLGKPRKIDDELQEQIRYLLNTANLDCYAYYHPEVHVIESGPVAFCGWLEKMNCRPYRTEVQLYKSLLFLKRSVDRDLIVTSQREALQTLRCILSNIEYRFYKDYGMELEDKRTVYGDCAYRLVPREDEPSVCLMHDWIYLPSA